MTFPNFLSLMRIPLLFVIIGGLMINTPTATTVALIAFILAFLSDWLDGFFARMLNQVTKVGAVMDALVDKIFVLGLFFYFFHIDLIPGWGLLPLIIMLTREFLITGLRMCALMRNRVLSAESPGKIKTVVQFLSLFFLILVPYAKETLGVAPQIMAIADFLKFSGRLLFAVAAFFTVTSGTYYLWRYRYLLGEEPKAA